MENIKLEPFCLIHAETTICLKETISPLQKTTNNRHLMAVPIVTLHIVNMKSINFCMRSLNKVFIWL